MNIVQIIVSLIYVLPLPIQKKNKKHNNKKGRRKTEANHKVRTMHGIQTSEDTKFIEMWVRVCAMSVRYAYGIPCWIARKKKEENSSCTGIKWRAKGWKLHLMAEHNIRNTHTTKMAQTLHKRTHKHRNHWHWSIYDVQPNYSTTQHVCILHTIRQTTIYLNML